MGAGETAQTPERPPGLAEYEAWLRQTFRCEPRRILQARYDAAASKALDDVRRSTVWQAIVGSLRDLAEEYLLATGYRLFVTDDPPELFRKGFDSFFQKTYRHNVLHNEAWPEEPHDGWRDPDAWLSMVNDIVRTTLVVKYLDGVPFLLERLSRICAEQSCFSHSDYEAREEGYYAGHFYFVFPVEVPRPSWETEIVNLSVEIQVTTQLQEVIRRLTHQHYEHRRMQAVAPVTKWQWDYRAEEFAPNYLGHILHYLEGMIMEIRERPDGAKGSAGHG